MASRERIGAKTISEVTTVLASAAQTTTSAGETSVRMPPAAAYVFVLDVTAAATEVGDELDVFIQTKVGDFWLDVIHFTQVLGNGGAKTYVAKVAAGAALTEYETGTALGAAAIRDICGDEWRVRFTVTDAGADNASWTFSVVGIPM